MRILAVDDEQIVLDLLGYVLETAGYTEVVFTHSSEEALDAVSRSTQPFDCFMLDIVMPGMDGIELCATLRHMPEYKTTPIIMISRMTDKLHFDRAFAAGASDYVTKPFDGIELGTRVRLAENISNQQKTIRNADAQLSDLQTALHEKQKVRLSSPFMLENVPGAIENLALENYLLHLSGGMFGMQFIAFKITNVADIHRKATGDEFRLVINSVAEIIAEDLADTKFFISYAGNGLYSCVIAGRYERTKDEIIRSLLREMQDYDFQMLSGDTVRIDLVAGASCAPKIVSSRKAVQYMREAAMNAETIARELSLRSAFDVPSVQNHSGLIARVLSAF